MVGVVSDESNDLTDHRMMVHYTISIERTKKSAAINSMVYYSDCVLLFSRTRPVHLNEQTANEQIADSLGVLPACQGRESLPLTEHSVHTVQSVDASALLAALLAIQAQHQLFPPATAANPQTVIVGVSGGADSVCLLHLLYQLASVWNLDLHVAHLDHALRADSASDADFVQELAIAWHLPFHRKRLVPGALAAAAGSVETAARQARQQFFARLAISLSPSDQQPIVVLAHHADDQAETLLHHLVRGSGLQGLGGMKLSTNQHVTFVPADSDISAAAQVSTIAENQEVVIQFVRPLLYVRRATILQYLRQQKLAWREDYTNSDQRYTRNYLRHTVLPALTALNPAVVEALGRTATIAADEMSRLAIYDRQQLTALRWPNTNLIAPPIGEAMTAREHASPADDQFVFDLTQLRTLPNATQRALLRQAAALVTPAARELSFAQVTELCGAITQADAGGPHPLLADLMWSVAGATATRPALLSLHRRHLLPFVMGQPLLAEGSTHLLPAVPLGETVRLPLANGWQLTTNSFARSELPADWLQRGQPWQAFFDSAQVGRPILIAPTSGQRFAPLGLHGQHKMLGDFFTDQKIPVALRSRWPLLVDTAAQEILWVCGLRIGHAARITDATRTVLCVTFECMQ